MNSTHLENAERTEFIELHEHEDSLTVRLGLTGHPCLVLRASFTTPGKGQIAHDKLMAKWDQAGFTECSPAAPVIDGSFADQIFCDESPQDSILETFYAINGAAELRGTPRRLAIFRSGLRWTGDFDFERLARLGLYSGVIVIGDIEVSGVLSQLSPVYPPQILVVGDVRAASFGHRDSHMRVTGDMRVENIIYGEYNDGSLHIEGAAHGRAWISSGHDMCADGGYSLPVSDWDSGDNWEGCLHPELFEIIDGEIQEDAVSEDAIRAFMRDGRSPFRPGATPSVDL